MVIDAHHVALPAFATIAEANAVPINLGMMIAKRRQTERAIGLGVFLVPDANARGLQQPHDAGQHLLVGNAFLFEIATLCVLPNPRQHFGKVNHPFVFILIARFSPVLVIQILLSPFRVPAGRLDVAVGKGTNPNIDPRRRNHKRRNSIQRLLIVDRLAANAQINKTPASVPALEAWLSIVNVQR